MNKYLIYILIFAAVLFIIKKTKKPADEKGNEGSSGGGGGGVPIVNMAGQPNNPRAPFRRSREEMIAARGGTSPNTNRPLMSGGGARPGH